MTASLLHLNFRPRGCLLRVASGRGAGGRARWWLWGVLPYLWLALFSEAFHTHAPLLCPASWAVASACHAPQHRPHATHGAGWQDASPASKSIECLACQWLTCSVALLGALALLRLALACPELVPWACAAFAAWASRFCSRGPPAPLMFAA